MMGELKFQPKCLACTSNFQVVEAMGLAMEGGQLTCKSCGEHHTYTIFDGRLILKRTSVPSGFVGSTEETLTPLPDAGGQLSGQAPTSQDIPQERPERAESTIPRKRGPGKQLKWILPLLGVVIVAVVFGYLKFFAWNPERQRLAMINDRKITVAQFDRELAKVPPPFQEVLKEEPKQFLEQLILKEVLLQEAVRQGLKSDPAAKGEEAEMSLIQNLLKKEVLDKIQVNPQEVEEVYKQHRDQMGKKPLNEVSPVLEGAIREVKGKEKSEEYVVSLKNKAKIEIDENRLKEITILPPTTNSKEDFSRALKSGRPVLVDFGSNSCLPCRQIRPILKELEREYTGKAEVLVVDVYQLQDLAREYRVQLIPTLIFFDKGGKEVFRHVGAWDKANIVSKLKEAGAA